MFKEIEGYLRYYRGLHKRTVRDIGALPAEAESYKPETGEGENSWSIGEIVRHMAGSRLYFARAYRDEGWFFGDAIRECASQDDCLPALEESFELFTSRLDGTPAEWLERKIPLIDTDGVLSGWRIPHDVPRARSAPPLAARYIRRPTRLGGAAHLRPLSGASRLSARTPATPPPGRRRLSFLSAFSGRIAGS